MKRFRNSSSLSRGVHGYLGRGIPLTPEEAMYTPSRTELVAPSARDYSGTIQTCS